jgi:hypothetical protein
MKVYSIRRYCPNLEEGVTEWFRNRTDAQKRRTELLKSYADIDQRERHRFEWALSGVSTRLIPETKDELIRWLNSNANRS